MFEEAHKIFEETADEDWVDLNAEIEKRVDQKFKSFEDRLAELERIIKEVADRAPCCGELN